MIQLTIPHGKKAPAEERPAGVKTEKTLSFHSYSTFLD